MIIRLIVLLAFIAAPCFAAGADYPTPSYSQIKQIKSWWKPENRESPDEEFDIGRVYPIRLKSGEEAYVASVEFSTRGRCCSVEMLLVRPELQEARQIDPHHILVSPRILEVVDLDGGLTAGLVIAGAFTGQGYTSGNWNLLYFDEWKPVTIFSQKFEDNLGAGCGPDSGRPCHSEKVEWVLVDLDGDRTKDLVETIVYCDGEEPDQMSCKTTVNAYLIKDLQLVPAPPGLIQSNLPKSQGQAKYYFSGPTDMQGHKSQSINAPEKELLVDDEAIISKCRSGLDQAVTTARDILSQFGLTSAEPR